MIVTIGTFKRYKYNGLSNMRNAFLVLLFSLYAICVIAQVKTNVYLLPGEGSDFRIFKYLELDNSIYTINFITYPIPEKEEDMKSYARSISNQIDTNVKFILIGVSLGGMLSVEMADFLHPEKVITISSAKNFNELPWHYRIQKRIPLYKIFTGRFMKGASFIAQPLFEPDRKLEKQTCVSMLKNKEPKFMKRTTAMILSWDRIEYSETVVAIHGNNDHTLPIKNVKVDYQIEGGSHMMILTKPNPVNAVINKILR